MKILVIGSGGREHAILDALARNKSINKLYAAPGNGGIREVAELVPIAADDIASLRAFAAEQQIDLTFVGPEVPLSQGIVDSFRTAGLTIVGPTADQARLESSKSYSKQFFRANGIPTADFHDCMTPAEAYALLDAAAYPLVIKADGLAAGKGVIIAADRAEAQRAIEDLMEKRLMGTAGCRLVIEEFLEGDEASFMVFADGLEFQPMVVAQDHKRRFDGDLGPNTGGMGAYSTDSILAPGIRQAVIDSIIQPTIAAAKSYSGILFAGLMLTSRGPRIIEYNARFGDPETQVVLPRLKTDLLEVLVAMTEHRLGSCKLEWSSDATASVALVASGYPGKPELGKRIEGLESVRYIPDVKVYHAGTRFEDGHYYTAGGRVLNVTARGRTLSEALSRAYAAVEMIEFEGKDYRRDIGKKGLVTQQ